MSGETKDDSAAENAVAALAEAILDRVTEAMNGVQYTIGLDDVRDKNYWVVRIFESPAEIAGGKHDGTRLYSGFNMDLTDVLRLFDGVGAPENDSGPYMEFCSLLHMECEDAPFIILGGHHSGVFVDVKILVNIPDDAEAGEQVDHRQFTRRPPRDTQ